MSATPRDLLKSRRARIGEVYSLNHLKAGQANSQVVSFGCDLSVGTTNTQLAVSAGEFVLAQSVVAYAGTAAAGVAIPVTPTYGAGTFAKILVEVNAAGTISFKFGSSVTTAQVDAPLPKGDTDKVSLGWIETSGAFTGATTVLTGGMLKKMPYWDITNP
jgi:hypothetical protein